MKSSKSVDPIAEFNKRSLEASASDIERSQINMDMDEREAFDKATGAISEGEDLRLEDEDLIEFATNRYCALIVEEGTGPLKGRRVLAVADDDVPGRWNNNAHATPEQREYVETAVSLLPELDVDELVRDVADVALEMQRTLQNRYRKLVVDEDQMHHEKPILPGAGTVRDWRGFCGSAGRIMHDEFKRAQAKAGGIDPAAWKPAVLDFTIRVLDVMAGHSRIPDTKELRGLARHSISQGAQEALSQDGAAARYSLPAAGPDEEGQALSV